MNKIVLKSSALLASFLIAAPMLATVAGAATVDTYPSTATVTFQQGNTPTNPTNPVDPGDDVDPYPEPDPDPSHNGPLSINYASTLKFGTQNISSSDATYYAHAQQINDETNGNYTVPNYVQVTDTRGTFAGWTLSVNTDSQFHLASVDPTETSESEASLGDYLTGATLKFNGGFVSGEATVGTPSTVISTVTVGTSAQTLMAAKTNEGMGTWHYGMGAGISGTENSVLAANNAAYQENGGAPLDDTAISTTSPITLLVPGSTAKKNAAYTTNLVWTLSDTPGN